MTTDSERKQSIESMSAMRGLFGAHGEELLWSRERAVDELATVRQEWVANRGVWSRDLEIRAMRLIFELSLIVHASKSKTYGPSWKKRGWGSVWANMCRKWDRLESIFSDPMSLVKYVVRPDKSSKEEAVIDTIGDLGNYSFLAVTELLFTQHEMFDRWLSTIAFAGGEPQFDKKDVSSNMG